MTITKSGFLRLPAEIKDDELPVEHRPLGNSSYADHMCNRMTQAQLDRIKELAQKAFDLALEELLQAAFNAAPTDLLPVVIERDGSLRAEMMSWGVKPGPAAPFVTLARDDSLLNPQKRMFKNSAQKRRCAILADGFYEFQTVGRTSVPHYFFLKDREPFVLAGLYEPPAEAGGPSRCLVVTTTPNAVVEPVIERMPVILSEEVRRTWLSNLPLTPENLPVFCKPYPAEQMQEYRTDSRMNNSRYKEADAIEPWKPDPGEFDFLS